MRVVIAMCSVEYSGRLSTTLPAAVRAIIIKEDGSVSVHADDKAYKPLNWMTKPRQVEMPPADSSGKTRWVFATRHESLIITIEGILSDHSHRLETSDPGLNKKGTERDLQAWLSRNPHQISPDAVFLAREFPLASGGYIDLLLQDDAGVFIVVEVKRVASIGGADQLSRYVEAMEDEGKTATGVLAAFDVRPRARTLCERRGFKWVEVSKEAFLAEA